MPNGGRRHHAHPHPPGLDTAAASGTCGGCWGPKAVVLALLLAAHTVCLMLFTQTGAIAVVGLGKLDGGQDHAVSPHTPEQLHLALAGRDVGGYATGLTVTFFTQDAAAVCDVGYTALDGGDRGGGKDGQQQQQQQQAEVAPRNALGGDANPNAVEMQTAVPATSRAYLEGAGAHHTAYIGPLVEGREYAYRAVCEARATSSTPLAASRTFATRFAVRDVDSRTLSVFGDLGYLSSRERPAAIGVLGRLVGGLSFTWSAIPTRVMLERFTAARDVDFVWHLGDISYADDAWVGNGVGGLYEATLNRYGNWMENITGVLPYHVTAGNHEAECHSPECLAWNRRKGHALANFTAFNHRYRMPSEESGGALNMWYSWNYGPVHFVSADTETDGSPTARQRRSHVFPTGPFAGGQHPAGAGPHENDHAFLTWLERDLKQAHAEKRAGLRPWIVVGGHRPCCYETPGLKGLLAQYEVDLYISGHRHFYARSTRSCRWPACERGAHHHTTPDDPAPTHTSFIVVGGAGNDEMGVKTPGATAAAGARVYRSDELATGLLTVVNRTALRWRAVASVDGRVLDDVMFTKH